MRTQFAHVIDVAPTVLEAAGLPEPTFVNGVQQTPIQGTSMRYSFDDAAAAERHETQYFEMFGNRGIYHKGWTAVTRHKTPWLLVGEDVPAFDDDVWELYDTSADWTQAEDLAAREPERLHHLQRLFVIEATKNNVLPLDDRAAERLVPEVAGRPVLVKGDRQRLFGGMSRLSEHAIVSIKNKSHAVTAEIDVPEGGAQGVVIAQGGSIGGWALYLVKDGRLRYCYNLFGIQRFYVGSEQRDPGRRAPGADGVRLRRAGPRQGRHGRPCTSTASRSATARSGATAAMIFSADDTCDVGREGGALVAERLPRPERLHGRGALGRDRRRRGRRRRRPHARRRRAAAGGDGEAVTRPVRVARMPIRILLGEDSLLVREGVQRLLAVDPDVEVVGAAADEESLRQSCQELQPDVVLADIRMPPTNTDEGIRFATDLRDSDPDIGVVILSQFADPTYALALFERGSDRRAYLLKERLHNRAELMTAIRAVVDGGSMIDPKIVEGLVNARGRAESSPLNDLTARERDVLAEIARGKSNSAIAEELFLTKRAVEKHINSIFLKLGLAYADDVSKRVKATLMFLADVSPPVAP